MSDTKLSHYEILGGEVKLRELVSRFYHLMDTLPEAKGIRKMHSEDLTAAAEKLFAFLSGWLGGPPLFMERHGHPMLRRRHFPFAIGESERDQWMLCMKQAMHDVNIPDSIRAGLEGALFRLADHLQNSHQT